MSRRARRFLSTPEARTSDQSRGVQSGWPAGGDGQRGRHRAHLATAERRAAGAKCSSTKAAACCMRPSALMAARWRRPATTTRRAGVGRHHRPALVASSSPQWHREPGRLEPGWQTTRRCRRRWSRCACGCRQPGRVAQRRGKQARGTEPASPEAFSVRRQPGWPARVAARPGQRSFEIHEVKTGQQVGSTRSARTHRGDPARRVQSRWKARS